MLLSGRDLKFLQGEMDFDIIIYALFNEWDRDILKLDLNKSLMIKISSD